MKSALSVMLLAGALDLITYALEIKRPLPPITEVTEPFAPEEVSSKFQNRSFE